MWNMKAEVCFICLTHIFACDVPLGRTPSSAQKHAVKQRSCSCILPSSVWKGSAKFLERKCLRRLNGYMIDEFLREEIGRCPYICLVI